MSVTLKDIAKIADVSIGTVSRVINGKTSEISDATVERVQKIIKEVGYVPNVGARSLKTNKTNTLGLLVPNLRNPFFTEVVQGAEDAADELGYSIILGNTYDDFKKETRYLNKFHQLRVDGIVIAGAFERNEEIESEYNFDVPLVAIERAVYYKNITTFIYTNNYESSYRIAETLYKNNYRSFLYLGGPETNSIAQERYQGTYDALSNKNITRFDTTFKSFNAEDGFRTIQNLNNVKDYDVIICGNDLLAIGAINALNLKGINVPEQISVVGFDDMKLISSFGSSLSTVEQPSYQIGQDAIKLIVDTINGETVPTEHKLKQTIKFRETTNIKA